VRQRREEFVLAAVRLAQRFFHAPPLGDVDHRPDPAIDPVPGVLQRHSPTPEPAIDAVVTTVAHFRLEGRTAPRRFDPALGKRGAIVRMDHRFPPRRVQCVDRQAAVFHPALVGILDPPRGVADPDEIRGRFAERAVQRLTPAQLFLGALALGDVDADADQRRVREADVRPGGVDVSAVARAHADIHPSLPARLHELRDLLAVGRVRIAGFHERLAGHVLQRPADHALELPVQAQDLRIRLVDRDHHRNAVDDGLQQLPLARQGILDLLSLRDVLDQSVVACDRAIGLDIRDVFGLHVARHTILVRKGGFEMDSMTRERRFHMWADPFERGFAQHFPHMAALKLFVARSEPVLIGSVVEPIAPGSVHVADERRHGVGHQAQLLRQLCSVALGLLARSDVRERSHPADDRSVGADIGRVTDAHRPRPERRQIEIRFVFHSGFPPQRAFDVGADRAEGFFANHFFERTADDFIQRFSHHAGIGPVRRQEPEFSTAAGQTDVGCLHHASEFNAFRGQRLDRVVCSPGGSSPGTMRQANNAQCDQDIERQVHPHRRAGTG